jgi:hypothetical protein
LQNSTKGEPISQKKNRNVPVLSLRSEKKEGFSRETRQLTRRRRKLNTKIINPEQFVKIQ